jgi:nickel transport protein
MGRLSSIMWTSFSNLRYPIFVFFLLSSPTFAHGIRVFASAEGKTINGRVTYQNGDPVINCTVTGHDANDEVLGKAETGKDGRFSFEAKFRCDYHLEAETNDGHGGEFVLKAEMLPADLPPREIQTPTEKKASEHGHHDEDGISGENPWTVEQLRAIQANVNDLREKLEAHDTSIRLRDILGGIGFILGVFGLYAIILNNRKKNHT